MVKYTPTCLIGKRLNAVMQAEKLTQEFVAKQTGVPRSTVWDILHGVTDYPRRRTEAKLSQFVTPLEVKRFAFLMGEYIASKNTPLQNEEPTKKVEVKENIFYGTLMALVVMVGVALLAAYLVMAGTP